MVITKRDIIDVILVVIGIIIVALFFRRSAPTNNNNVDKIIEAQNETIKAVERERDTYREWKDSAVAALGRKNEVLATEYKTIVTKYAKIPDNINNLSRDSLRAAVQRY